MSKKERTKGAAFEREVAKLLHPFWPSARRNIEQYQSSDGRDLSDTQPICFQLKRRKMTKLWEIKHAYFEADESTDEDYPYPAAVWRDDNGDAMVMMKVEHLVEMLCKIEDRGL